MPVAIDPVLLRMPETTPAPIQKKGRSDAARLIEAIGQIGYKPVDALLDIADNSVSAGASHVAIRLTLAQDDREGPGRKKAVVESFTILDDGRGMDEAGLDNALALGSSSDYYESGTLSKFGLGLKSAASSLGRRLEIVSRKEGDDAVRKVVMDHSALAEAGGEYVYMAEPVPEADVEELDAHTSGGSGTIIRITDVRRDSLPKVSDVISGLRDRIGVVYHYYIKGEVGGRDPLRVTVDGEEIEAIDPLFEADAEGDLDETSWDGTSVRWITREQPIQLDLTGDTTATVTITQLPHPPSVKEAEEQERAVTRREYLIEAGNYGFYIYRNHRLISWADRLDGMVPMDKKLYGFRGRILIESDADDLLNINVSKDRIQLSEIAVDQIKPELREAVKKSQTAWQHRTDTLRAKTSDTPHDTINDAIDRAAEAAEKDKEIDEQVAPPDEKKELEERRERAKKAAAVTEEEREQLSKERRRVHFVDHLDNDQLWQRAHDAEQGLIVRVNQRHRFVRDVLDLFPDDAALIKAFDLLFFALAQGEYDFVYKSEISDERAEVMAQEYRERFGAALSELVRRVPQDALKVQDD